MATLFSRGGIWYGRHVTYVDGKRRDVKRSFETVDRTVAARRLAQWEAEMEAERWGERPRITFPEAAQRFLNEHCRSLAEASVERYRGSLKHLRKHLGDKLVADISRADLLDFEMARRRDKGVRRAPGRAGRRVPLSASSIRRDLNCLSSLMSFCVAKEWIDSNPVPAFLKARKASGLREGQPKVRYLSHEEEARLLQSLATGPNADRHDAIMLRAAVILAIDTGMREAELLGTLWQNVHLSGNPRIFVPRGTNDRDRTIPLFDRAANVVSSLPVYRDAKWLLWAERNRGDRYQSFKKGFRAACARAGLLDVTWHDLRRTCGCRLLQDHGASMLEVSRWLGHSSIMVTEKHYAFLKQDALAGIVERARDRQETQPSAEIVPMRRKV